MTLAERITVFMERAGNWCGHSDEADAMTQKQEWYSWFLKVPDLRVAKRIVVGVIGGTVTLIGIALIVLPGPAFIVIPIGLSILATEFLWAKRWLRKAREAVTRIKNKRRDA